MAKDKFNPIEKKTICHCNGSENVCYCNFATAYAMLKNSLIHMLRYKNGMHKNYSSVIISTTNKQEHYE